MAAITASMIKELRDRTGIGMTKCKAALEEAQGNMDLAIDNLRKSGAASAIKKEGRETKEGLIAIGQSDDAIAVVEVNAETDFVVKNERFREFLELVGAEAAAAKPESLESFLKTSSQSSEQTIEEMRANLVQAIGENIQVSRIKVFPKGNGQSVGFYRHLGGKIVVVVEIEGNDEDSLASDIAMHIAASAPDYVSHEDIPADLIEKEKEIARVQMAGKPENILEKIITGKLNAFYDDVCLLRQKFIRDEDVSVGQLVENRAKETGKPLAIKGFISWSVGKK